MISAICVSCRDEVAKAIRRILFTNESESAKMPRFGHGDKFYVGPYKESEAKDECAPEIRR